MNLLNVIFYNRLGRVRSGWRALIFLLSFFFSVLFLSVVIKEIVHSLPVNFTEGSLGYYVLQFALGSGIALFLGWICGRFFEDLPFRALGAWFTKNWFRDLIAGCLIGIFSIAAAMLIAFIGGGLSFKYNDSAGSSAMLLTLGVSLGIFVLGAAAEEILFRGYLLQTLSRANLAWPAILLTSAFFASAHLGNESVNLISTLNTALAGIWLGAAYLKTRNLWFPFGIHLMWNWFQGAFFGVEVSGITKFTTAPVLHEIDLGPAWLTGETYGIEGGIACTIALLVSMALIYFLPFVKPTEELLAFSSEEKPIREYLPESAENIRDPDA